MKAKRKARISSDNVKVGAKKKLNPFEVHINRSKHQVLGRKLKSDRGLPGVAKNKALMKRKNTLLQEYKIRGKSNQFIDQRIGERNKNMTEDDRIMARFAAERMRMFNKKAMFNLSDTEVLTHKGQTLSEIERFEDTRSDDEEDDEGRRTSGALKGKFVESAHFGGGMLTKSKQDRESLIDELINESKKRKAERQRNKEETLEATEQLDEDWKTLGMIVTSTKDTGDVNNQKKDQYDIVMRQLKFEPHGQPSQRLKTEEEIVREDKEQLEKLEKERLKQLREIEQNKYGAHKSADDLEDGFANFAVDLTEDVLAESDKEDESSDEDEGSSEAASDDEVESETDAKESNDEEENDVIEEEELEESTEPKKKRIKVISDKGFEGKTDMSESLKADEDEEIKSPSIDNAEDSCEEESSDEDCAMDDFSDLMPSTNVESTNLTIDDKVTPQSKSTEVKEKQDANQDVSSEAEVQVESDIPFVLNIPETYESFRDLLQNKTLKQHKVVFERLIKNNHPSLEPGNKKKLLTLAGHIIEHVSKGDITWDSLPVFVSQFNILKDFNKEECLKLMVNSLSSKLDDLDRSTLPVHSVKYLTWYILVFLQPQGLDILVPISKPALSLACSLVTRTHHVSLGLLCCYLLLQDAKISSVMYPEAISYLNGCVKRTDSQQKKSDKKQNNNNVNRHDEADFRLPLNFDIPVEEDHKVLYCSVMLLSEFVKVYRKYPQSKILFKQVENSVADLQVETYPQILQKCIAELQTLLKVLSTAHLPSLAKHVKKPKALRQYEPLIHIVTIGKWQRGLPAEQQEEQKLLHKYKHEMKGAMRELRRDRVFLANVKLKEKALSDEQRIKKVKEIFSSGAAQQGELRSLKRKK